MKERKKAERGGGGGGKGGGGKGGGRNQWRNSFVCGWDAMVADVNQRATATVAIKLSNQR